MDHDDHVCLCHRVSLRKLVNFMNREQPTVPSQLSECLNAGTGCQWCVPYLRDLHAQWQKGMEPTIDATPEDYAAGRARYRGRDVEGREGPQKDVEGSVAETEA